MNIKKVMTLGMLNVILYTAFTSCRSNDTENVLNSSGASLGLKFNILGTQFSDDSSAKQAQASVGKAGVLSGAVQTDESNTIKMLTPSMVVISRVSTPAGEIKPLTLASSKLSTVAAVAGNPLAQNVMYRVIAYDSNGNYKNHMDYTVGQTAQPLVVDQGVTYTLVAFTYGTPSLPPVDKTSTLSSATVSYDNNNRDFMYWQQAGFIANSAPPQSETSINITFHHKLTLVNGSINMIGFNGPNDVPTITAVGLGTLTPHYTNGTFQLSSGNMIDNTRTSLVPETFVTASPLGGKSVKLESKLINANTTTGNFTVVSIAALNNGSIGGGTGALTTLSSKNITLTPGYQKNIDLDIVKCGAYTVDAKTGTGKVWREFTCFNLGADKTADPMKPSASISGDKYQFGAKTGESGFYITQSTDLANTGIITGWNSNASTKPINAWNAGTETTPIKSANDPCPSGFRIPTQTEWINVGNYNSFTEVGTWTNPQGSNFDSGMKFGDALFFPASNLRWPDSSSGRVPNNGGKAGITRGNFWSSTGSLTCANETAGLPDYACSGGQQFAFEQKGPGFYPISRGYGLGLRCISEN